MFLKKNFGLCILGLLFLIVNCQSSISGTLLAGNFYVSLSGDDSFSGTIDYPWKSINNSVNRVAPGSTVNVLPGIFHEDISFDNSGSISRGFITLQAADGDFPVIDGSYISEVPSLITLEDVSFIRVKGFEIRNLIISDKDFSPCGILVTGYGSNIEILDNKIHNIENETEDGESGAHGIAFYGNSEEPLRDLVIDGNEIYNCKLGWSESLVLNGNVTNFRVSGNHVHHNNNIGIDFIGFEGTCPETSLDSARNGVCTDNLVEYISTTGNPSYKKDLSAGGIYVDGGSHIIIERNVVRNCDIGIEIASEHAGRSTDFVIVRNNFISESYLAGLSFGGYDKFRGSTESCIIVNNTLYNNSFNQEGEILIQFDTRNNIVANNIIYGKGPGSTVFINNQYSENMDNIFINNIYYSQGDSDRHLWIWEGVEYWTLDSFKKSTGQDKSSLFIDPVFYSVEDGDYHITSESPAVNMGLNLNNSGDKDIDAERRITGLMDIGADEINF